MVLGSKQKLAIILIVVIVAVPSIGFGVYYGINRTSNNIINNTEISISSVQILSADNSGMNISIQGIVDNPSTISANMDNLNLSVNYNSVEIGMTQIKAMSISGGNNSINQQVFMTVTNQSEFSTFLNDFVKLANVTVSVNGTASITASGINLSKDITKDITLNGLNNQLGVNVQNFGIVNASTSSFYANITTQIQNPSSISMSLKNVNFDIYCNNTLLGNLTIPSLQIGSGTTLSNNTVLVNLENTTLFNDISTQILSDNDVNLQLKGLSSTDNILSPVFSALNLNFTLKGLPPANVMIMQMTIVNSTANSVGFNVTLQITNPTLNSLSASNLQFNVYYKDQQIGIVNFTTLTVLAGTHTYTIPSTMTFTNTSLLSNLLSAYLGNNPVVFQINGSSTTGSSVLDQVVAHYVQDITLPTFGNLNYELSSISLDGSTSDSLLLSSFIEIQNPTTFDLTISNLVLNVTYQQSWIGNLTFPSTSITPGNNSIDVSITLSGDQNITAVDNFLGAYIAGGTIPLSLNGNIDLELAGMQNTISSAVSFNTDISGTNQTLINDVKVMNVEVSFDPTTFTGSMTASCSADVVNPFSFDINITSLAYSVYFNDPEGYTYSLIVGSITGSAESNIFIDNPSKDYSSSPIALTASATNSLPASISNSNADTCARLNYEYTVMNDLYVNIDSGVMGIQIGAFSTTVNFSFSNISVPSNA